MIEDVLMQNKCDIEGMYLFWPILCQARIQLISFKWEKSRKTIYHVSLYLTPLLFSQILICHFSFILHCDYHRSLDIYFFFENPCIEHWIQNPNSMLFATIWVLYPMFDTRILKEKVNV